jgi:hypothetical protein
MFLNFIFYKLYCADVYQPKMFSVSQLGVGENIEGSAFRLIPAQIL